MFVWLASTSRRSRGLHRRGATYCLDEGSAELQVLCFLGWVLGFSTLAHLCRVVATGTCRDIPFAGGPTAPSEPMAMTVSMTGRQNRIIRAMSYWTPCLVNCGTLRSMECLGLDPALSEACVQIPDGRRIDRFGGTAFYRVWRTQTPPDCTGATGPFFSWKRSRTWREAAPRLR
jgi:hypothetical protein